MGTRRDGQKSAKSALPKQSSSSKFPGFSFKALEEEEEDNEEDLTLFTGKFDKIVEEKHKQRSTSTTPNIERPPSAPLSDSKLSKLHPSSKSLEEGCSSPSKKNKASVFEYKEIITGIKDKISDTKEKITESINKRLEEFSNDASPTSEQPKTLSEVTGDHPLNPDLLDKEIGEPEEKIYDQVHSAPAALSELGLASAEPESEDSIEVVESYFGEEPFETFDGEYGILRGTSTRNRKKKVLAKKAPSFVSMSNLITTPGKDVDITEELDSVQQEVTSTVDNKNNDTSPLSEHQQPTTESTIPWQRITTFSILLFVFFVIPLPSFISGLIVGAILASAGWSVYLWLIEPPSAKPIIEVPPLDEAPQIKIPQMKEPTKEKGVYKGWMNELLEYNPDDYHINQTHSVFVVLEGTHLRLQRPKINMPKRAMWDEALSAPHFIHQRHIQIKDSRIFLMPAGLVDKRLWSKKYPICLALAHDTKGSTKKTYDTPKKLTPDDDSSDFEMVTEEKCSNKILYLFARTCPEKEEWYKRLRAAALGKPLGNHILDIYKALSFTSKIPRKSSEPVMKHRRHSSTDSTSSVSSQPESPNNPNTSATESNPGSPKNSNLQTFAEYMGHLMPSHKEINIESLGKTSSPRPQHFKHDPTDIRQISGSLVCDAQLIWLNSIIGRCFWDFLRDEWWAEKVREKLQKKLSKIHVPYFIEELKVTHIDLGFEMPVIRRAGMPYIDEQGFWVDLDLVYNGGFRMTIETKLNLMKLRKATTSSEVDTSSQTSPVTDPNEEDSAESSTDDDEESQVPASTDGSSSSGGTSRKLMKYIDKIAQSRYFQQAYEYKYIKKAMEGVSNTPLELSVEVKSLNGVLAVNIPPPDTDRLWYGFRKNPSLSLSAKPKVGEREVTITHVTDWIEKKLSTEFQRVFVMPNMDDLKIPILLADIPSDVVPTVPYSDSSSAV